VATAVTIRADDKFRTLREAALGEAPRRSAPVHPERVTIFGGLTGAALEVPEFIVAPGLIVREAFAHVFGTYMVAFSKPPHARSPHPGPWVAATGGVGFDVYVEVALAQDARPTGFDRLNSLWWFLALLRLRSSAVVRMPVISSAAFAVAPKMSQPPTMWAMEVQAHSVRMALSPAKTISKADLDWISGVYVPGERLMRDAAFGRALALLDSIRWAHDPRAAVTLAWSALEAIVRPGRTGIKKGLACAIAALLADGREDRDRLFAAVTQAYEHRGMITHAAESADEDMAILSFDIARRFFSRCIELDFLPTFDQLLTAWKTGGAIAR
jgi:hypothetical protein